MRISEDPYLRKKAIYALWDLAFEDNKWITREGNYFTSVSFGNIPI